MEINPELQRELSSHLNWLLVLTIAGVGLIMINIFLIDLNIIDLSNSWVIFITGCIILGFGFAWKYPKIIKIKEELYRHMAPSRKQLLIKLQMIMWMTIFFGIIMSLILGMSIQGLAADPALAIVVMVAVFSIIITGFIVVIVLYKQAAHHRS